MTPDAPEDGTDYPVILGDSFTAGTRFHVLRYEFKPASADLTQTGLLTVNASDKAIVDLPNKSEDGQPISFTGKYEEGRDVECVLIFDCEHKIFRLERLTATVKNLRHDRRGGAQAAERLAYIPEPLPKRQRTSADSSRRGSQQDDDDDDEDDDAEFESSGDELNSVLEEPPAPAPAPAPAPSASAPPAAKGPPKSFAPAKYDAGDDEQMLDMAGNPVSRKDDIDGSESSFSSDGEF